MFHKIRCSIKFQAFDYILLPCISYVLHQLYLLPGTYVVVWGNAAFDLKSIAPFSSANFVPCRCSPSHAYMFLLVCPMYTEWISYIPDLAFWSIRFLVDPKRGFELDIPGAENDVQTMFPQFLFKGKGNFVEFQSYSLPELLIHSIWPSIKYVSFLRSRPSRKWEQCIKWLESTTFGWWARFEVPGITRLVCFGFL